ncbi:MAG: LD-carboxypeptidase [Bacilli bacterium]|nr:LD-carboxypeptidase [Bacilli bacterium]
MITPKYLNKGDTIGTTACSCGVLEKIDKYEKSNKNIKSLGFDILETPNVRTSGIVSSDPTTRAKELESLYKDSNVKAIAITSGGDFLIDMLDKVNYDVIRNNIKWLCGSSDPTSLLYTVTTNLDIATIYSPCNMSGFSSDNLHESYLNYFEILKGNLVKQNRYPFYESDDDIFDKENKWVNINGDVDETGTLIGGCIESLKDVIGTRFDKTNSFLEKYKDTIWYFDVFSMQPEDLYRTLIQFKMAGWFRYTKAIIIGKVRFPSSFLNLSYEKMIKKALPNMKVIYNFDVGHVKPSMTMINGFKVRVISNDNEGSLEYLK